MTVTHDIGAGDRLVQTGQPSTLMYTLSRLARLLNADWRNAGWMIDNSPLSLAETLADSRFTAWLAATANTRAATAAASFATLSRESQEVLATLVRCYRLDHNPPTWARNFAYA